MERIVDNYSGANFWYRKYSDGWIEQGGRTPTTIGADSTINVIFPITFTSVPISISVGVLSPRSSDSSGDEIGVKCDSNKTPIVSTTGLSFLHDGKATNKQGYFWEVKGY